MHITTPTPLTPVCSSGLPTPIPPEILEPGGRGRLVGVNKELAGSRESFFYEKSKSNGAFYVETVYSIWSKLYDIWPWYSSKVL